MIREGASVARSEECEHSIRGSVRIKVRRIDKEGVSIVEDSCRVSCFPFLVSLARPELTGT